MDLTIKARNELINIKRERTNKMENLKNLINTTKRNIESLDSLFEQCHVDKTFINDTYTYLNDLESLLLPLKFLVENYKKQINNDIRRVRNSFEIDFAQPPNITDELATFYRTFFENNLNEAKKNLEIAKFNLYIFNNFGFFEKNIVAIGANGSGKSSLASKLKSKYLGDNVVHISAQKILSVPNFTSISNHEDTQKALLKSQLHEFNKKKSSQFNFEYPDLSESLISDEFKCLLNNLLSENNKLNHKYIDSVRKEIVIDMPCSNLHKTIEIWNSLISHRKLECADGINIMLSMNHTTEKYSAQDMSDGEKIVLYYIAHILQAPEDSFIVIDEPEMHLHKSLLSKLWDILENKRQDCKFIYLTHDLDFATDRAQARKVWIKSFTHPDTWEIETIPESELPEPLVLQLLGSRKEILFCESEKGKLDNTIYNILLPSFTIVPVNSCADVIHHTKAFNKLPNTATRAYGLIDLDHSDEDRVENLKQDKVFTLNIAEIENLLFDEEFLEILADRLVCDSKSEIIENIKQAVIDSLSKNIEKQVANYVSAKINFSFNNSHVKQANTQQTVTENLRKFTANIVQNVDKWSSERYEEIQNIVKTQDYQKALTIINDKGLKQIADKNFNIGNFQERAIGLLRQNEESHQHLLKHLPIELREKNKQ